MQRFSPVVEVSASKNERDRGGFAPGNRSTALTNRCPGGLMSLPADALLANAVGCVIVMVISKVELVTWRPHALTSLSASVHPERGWYVGSTTVLHPHLCSLHSLRTSRQPCGKLNCRVAGKQVSSIRPLVRCLCHPGLSAFCCCPGTRAGQRSRNNL